MPDEELYGWLNRGWAVLMRLSRGETVPPEDIRGAAHMVQRGKLRAMANAERLQGVAERQQGVERLVEALEAYEAKQRSIIGNRDGGEMWQHDIDFIEACRREIRVLAPHQ